MQVSGTLKDSDRQRNYTNRDRLLSLISTTNAAATMKETPASVNGMGANCNTASSAPRGRLTGNAGSGIASVNFTALKMKQRAREHEEKKQVERRRGVLVLVSRFLIDNGFLESAERLQHESGVSLKRFEAADNMDLEHVVLEGFEEHFHMKFGKKPKLFRKIANAEDASISAGRNMDFRGEKDKPRRGVTEGGAQIRRQIQQDSGIRRKASSSTMPGVVKTKMDLSEREGKETSPTVVNGRDLDVAGRNAPVSDRKEIHSKDQGEATEEDHFENRLLKPIPDHLLYGEMRDLAETIQREIIMENPQVRWDDIAGLESSKQLVKEAVVMPLRYPELFTGLLTPWRGVLLFGPPGTGKTMLAKAVATECKTTFFNISASSIVSKWRGDSEKLVRVLFALAKHHAPATIFIDELDSILGKRSSENEHEGSRRMKTELLIQMDGLAKTSEHIFLLAASNLPWDLDPAILRRLEKRILVGLPDERSRHTIFRNLLNDRGKYLNYDELSRRTSGYSGADIMLTCKESAMRQLRKVMQELERFEKCKNYDGEKMQNIVIGSVTMDDVLAALDTTKPSGNVYGGKYERWQDSFGNTLAVSVDRTGEDHAFSVDV